MPEPKAQLIDPQGPIDVPGMQVTGVTTATGGFVGNVQGAATGLASTTANLSVGIVTATKFQGNTTGNVSGLADDTNINVGIITSTSFTGDLVGNAAGLSTTTANINAGIMSATSFAGNFTGVASGITGTPNIVVGIMTGTLNGDGSSLTGIAATNWIANNVPGSIFSINVTASGSSNYTLSGTDRSGSVSGSDPTVTVEIGDTLNFVVDASGHPFYIRVSDGGANVSTPAATNQGSQSGTVSWTPNTAGTYYYQCGNHAGMIGTITVTATTTIDLSLGNVVKFTQTANTTVSFANTGTTNIVTFIRPGADYTITWPSAIKWNDGSAPPLATKSADDDVFTLLTRDEGVTWYGWETLTIDKKANRLLLWGDNQKGQLGQNSVTLYSSPVQIYGNGTTWSKVSEGGGTVSTNENAIKTDGTLWAWGYNYYGVLGLNDRTDRSSPTQVPGTTWAHTVIDHSQQVYATKTDGTLWAWGRNDHGNLGQNNNTQHSSPIQIPGTSWATGDNKISSGYWAAAAIRTDGTLWTWGYGYNGTLGLNNNGNGASRSSPVQIPGTSWSTVSGSYWSFSAIKSDNTLWTWGWGSRGKLGLNDTLHRSSPTQVPGTTWRSSAMGMLSMLATKTDGTLWAWGDNQNGQLGQNQGPGGPSGSISSPVQIPGTNWASTISAGYDNIYASKTDGTLWGWGRNANGQLAQNNTTNYSSPVQIPGYWGETLQISAKRDNMTAIGTI